MIYNINGIEISENDFNKYIDSMINRLFAILGVYEDCEYVGDFSNFEVYLDRIITELSGGYYIIGSDNFITITNILTGIRFSKDITHKKVKSIVFHCISIIKKIKNNIDGDFE